jgi:FixJ family two-component response regulator
MTSSDSIVFVVDGDPVVREALYALLTSRGLSTVTFATAADYLGFSRPAVPACLILDVELPDSNGLELQGRIANAGHPPIVFTTGNGDIPSSVRAIKAGAVDFLTKPFDEPALLAAIDAAIVRDHEIRRERAELHRLQERLSCLTPRERQVLPLVVSGFLNKQSAAQLGISETTLQMHRTRIMHKMAAESFAALVRMAGKLSVPLPPVTYAPTLNAKKVRAAAESRDSVVRSRLDSCGVTALPARGCG